MMKAVERRIKDTYEYRSGYSEGFADGVAKAIEGLKHEFALARMGRPIVIRMDNLKPPEQEVEE